MSVHPDAMSEAVLEVFVAWAVARIDDDLSCGIVNGATGVSSDRSREGGVLGMRTNSNARWSFSGDYLARPFALRPTDNLLPRSRRRSSRQRLRVRLALRSSRVAAPTKHRTRLTLRREAASLRSRAGPCVRLQTGSCLPRNDAKVALYTAHVASQARRISSSS